VTVTDVFNDHARRVAEVKYWHTKGWISDEERIRYEVYDTEITETLIAQLYDKADY